MKLDLRMTLLTDAIFGNGLSTPGGEDLSVLCDENGFPYYKGGTFKGVFREELENYAAWLRDSENSGIREEDIDEKLGAPGDDGENMGKLRFYDFVIPQNVQKRVLSTVTDPNDILDAFTYLRTFTALDDEGIVKRSSLRSYRCIKAGITLTGAVECSKADRKWVCDVLGLIKWIGTMRNRGFGKVKIEVAGGMV